MAGKDDLVLLDVQPNFLQNLASIQIAFSDTKVQLLEVLRAEVPLLSVSGVEEASS